MKTFTPKSILVIAVIMLAALAGRAQCSAGFTWNQPSNNVISFTNTSTPNTPNSTYYNWNFGDSQYGWAQNPTHTYSVPGSYIVCLTVYDSLSSCQNSFCDTVTVTGNTLCNVSANAVAYQPASCSTCADGMAGAMMYGGTAPYTYAWSSGGTAQTESGLAPGSYTVCITDANGCNACDTVLMSYANNNCTVSFTASQTNANQVDFTNTSGNYTNMTIYMWDFGDNSTGWNNSSTPDTHTYANPGTYYVCLTVYDSATFCTNTFCDSVTVWGNVLPSNCDANFVIYPDSINTNQAWAYNLSTGGPNLTYQWFWGDNSPVDVIPYPNHIYNATGSYNICLVVLDTVTQCTDTMCTLLWVPRLSQQAASAPYYVNVLPMGIHENTQASWNLFPNPAEHELNIKSEYTLTGNTYRVLDVTGRIVITGKLQSTTIDVTNLDKGMYVLQIETAKGEISSKRFMKD
jgi:PKD repeat protein